MNNEMRSNSHWNDIFFMYKVIRSERKKPRTNAVFVGHGKCTGMLYQHYGIFNSEAFGKKYNPSYGK